MGINCNIYNKPIEEKNEIIRFSPPISSHRDLNNAPTISDSAQKIFNERFNKEIDELGEFIPNSNFQSQIPSNIKNYILKNKYDPYKKKKKNQNKQFYTIEPVKFQNGNIYKGTWNDLFEMDGYGHYYLKDDNVFVEGFWKNGELKNGRIFYPNGEIYEGEIKESLYNGKGRIIYNDNSIFEGNFIKGEKDKEGKIIYDDKSYYEGDIYNDIPNGKGIFKWNNNIIYNGEFKNGMFDGNGLLKNNNNGSFYNGNFKNNLYNGKGIFHWGKSNNEYNGEYKNGKKNGKGIYKKNNIIYEGYFNEGKPHGNGKIEDGKNTLKCEWRNGICVESLSLVESRYGDDNENKKIEFNVDNEDIDIKKLKYIKWDKNNNCYEYKPMISYSEVF